VRVAHVRLLSPLWALWSPQGDRPVGFAAARRRARGSACKTRRGKFPPTPLIARAKPAAASIPSACLRGPSERASRLQAVFQGDRRPKSPAVRVAPIGRVDCAGWLTLGSFFLRCVATHPELRGGLCFADGGQHFSRRATPCQSALVSSRRAVSAVARYAQRADRAC